MALDLLPENKVWFLLYMFLALLSPTFVSAPLVGVAVKLPFAFTLFARFPTVLRKPLSASVTL